MDEREESTSMKPTPEILKRIKENSTNYTDEKFTRLYRYLLREDIYYCEIFNSFTINESLTKINKMWVN